MEIPEQSIKPRVVGKNVLQAVVGGLELNDDQKTQIKEATGTDVEWILFNQYHLSFARDIDPSNVSLIKLSYCW